MKFTPFYLSFAQNLRSGRRILPLLSHQVHKNVTHALSKTSSRFSSKNAEPSLLQETYQKSLKSNKENASKIENDKSAFVGKEEFSQVSPEHTSREHFEESSRVISTPLGHYHEFSPRIAVIGVGGAGGNAINNMIARNLTGVEFLVCNTDAQHLSKCLTDNRLQLGVGVTHGLGCGANPDQGRLAAEESRSEILELIGNCNMVFIAAGMGGGTGTGAAPVIADACIKEGILTVGIVTKPFAFEGTHRMRLAIEGIKQMSDCVDTLITIPNQNLFKLVDNKTPISEAFLIADNVLLAGVKSVTDLMSAPGLINLDFADVKTVMQNMGNAIMGSGFAQGEDRALKAAEDALQNPLLGDISIKTAKGVLVNISGGADMTLFEVDKAATRITQEIEDEYANVIFGATYDTSLEGYIRVSVVATGIET